jgi:probable rRNA maturation factor
MANTRRAGPPRSGAAGAGGRREVRLHCRLSRPGIPREALVSFALDVLGRLGLEGEVGIKVCGNRPVAEMNERYRNKSGPTDVLSFPNGGPAPDGGVYIGDILIAAPVAARAAAEAGHPLEVELRRLILHGLLHLAGFDHEVDGGTMARKERVLRREWDL